MSQPLKDACHEDLAVDAAAQTSFKMPQLETVNRSPVVDACVSIIMIKSTLQEGMTSIGLPEGLPLLCLLVRPLHESVRRPSPLDMDLFDVWECPMYVVPLRASKVPEMHAGRSESEECNFGDLTPQLCLSVVIIEPVDRSVGAAKMTIKSSISKQMCGVIKGLLAGCVKIVWRRAGEAYGCVAIR